MSLRIGVNALYLLPGGVGGTEIYLRSLLAALARVDSVNRYFVFTNRETGAGIVPKASNFTWSPQRVAAQNRPARILWEQIVLPLAIVRQKIDVLFNPGFTAPLLCACPMVTVFHDLQHKNHPEYFRWFEHPFWRIFLFAAAHRSERLIAVSESTSTDLQTVYRLPAKRITVVPHGVDPGFFRLRRVPAPTPYLLCVSTLHPHKNLERLLRAFTVFHKDRPDFRLVVAGMRGFHTEELEKLRGALGLEDCTEFTGWIPRERLYDLYASAEAFIYPSTFEGFGMPILEAMAAGIPLGCSAIEPMSSLAGNAALQFHPDSTEEIVEAMRKLTSDEALRAKLAQTGPARASEFSWEAAARSTLAAVEATRASAAS